jgi:hypothetical protein
MNNFKDIIERLRSLGFEAQAVESDQSRPRYPGPSEDYAELSEKEFRKVIDAIDDIEILEGLANRRKWLSTTKIKKWSDIQRQIIIERKFVIEAKRNGKVRRGKARTANARV